MADTPKRAALYVRASGPGPSTGAQLVELAHIAKSAGWERAAIYRDTGVPAARGRGEHPEFDRMLRDATRRRFDVLLAWSVDRLARTLRELFATLAVLRAAGIDLYLKEQGVDTTAASGRALFETVGIFTELEDALARARVQAGVDRARKAGKPLGRPKIDAERADAIRASLAGGVSIRKAARLHHVGLSTVQRLKAALSGEASGSSPLPQPVVGR